MSCEMCVREFHCEWRPHRELISAVNAVNLCINVREVRPELGDGSGDERRQLVCTPPTVEAHADARSVSKSRSDRNRTRPSLRWSTDRTCRQTHTDLLRRPERSSVTRLGTGSGTPPSRRSPRVCNTYAGTSHSHKVVGEGLIATGCRAA